MNDLEQKQMEWDELVLHPERNTLRYGAEGQRGTVRFENEFCFYLQDDDTQVLPGSGMIMPKAARATVFDLSREEWNATYDLLQEVRTHLNLTLKPQGYSVGWNVNPVGGQHIPQAHLHIIPRFADEPCAGHGIRHWIKQPENRRDSVGLLTRDTTGSTF